MTREWRKCFLGDPSSSKLRVTPGGQATGSTSSPRCLRRDVSLTLQPSLRREQPLGFWRPFLSPARNTWLAHSIGLRSLPIGLPSRFSFLEPPTARFHRLSHSTASNSPLKKGKAKTNGSSRYLSSPALRESSLFVETANARLSGSTHRGQPW